MGSFMVDFGHFIRRPRCPPERTVRNGAIKYGQYTNSRMKGEG